MNETVQFKLKDIDKVVKKIHKRLLNSRFLALYGDLGSGKTTLTKALAKRLGIEDLCIKSPTYTFIRRYEKNHFFHIDLYRLAEIDDLLQNEIEEIHLDKKSIIVVEWADKMEEFLPKDSLRISLKYIDDVTREIKFLN